MSKPAGRIRLSRKKKIAFIVVVNVISLSLLLAMAEFGVRWRVRRGPLAAMRSFLPPAAERPGIANGWLMPDPDLGFKLSPEKDGVNDLGIRHGVIEDPKPEGLYRIIVLGDSVAWGKGGFVDLLDSRLRDLDFGEVEVINASIPGYTTYQQRTLFERDLSNLEPDLVLLQYCLNDNHRFLHRLDEHGDWLITRAANRALLPGGNGPLARIMKSSYLITQFRMAILAHRRGSDNPFIWERSADVCTAWQEWTWPVFEEHLTAISDLAAEVGARFALLAVPYQPQLRSVARRMDLEYATMPQTRLRDICGRLGVPFLDLYSAFLENRYPAPFSDRLHLTKAGHELVSERLFDFLQAQPGLLPSR